MFELIVRKLHLTILNSMHPSCNLTIKPKNSIFLIFLLQKMSDETIKLVETSTKPAQISSKPVRKHEDDDLKQPNKRQKSNVYDQPASNTKITDVIDDCLQPIFERIEFKDLCCVAIAHDNFKEVAGLVFARKYGKMEIRLTSDGITVRRDNNQMRSTYHGFSVKEPSHYIKFLQNLGDRISKLNIGLNTELYETLEPIMLQNCQDSLVELCLYKPQFGPSKLRNVFGSIKKSFPNIAKLVLNCCHLNEHASQLNVWFPKLERFTIFDCTFADPKVIIKKYQLLEYFSIGGWNEPNTLTKSQIYTILRLNPQIQSLDIGLASDGHELELYRQVNQILPALERLNLCWDMHSFKYHDNKIVTFKHLKSLVLDFRFNSFSGGRVLPLQFDQLIELEINHIPILTTEWMDFIIQQKGLTKLTVLPCDVTHVFHNRPNNQDLMRFGKELNNLNALKIDATAITTECLLQFMEMCKFLTELRLYWNVSGLFNSIPQDLLQHGPRIFAQFQDEWHIPLKTISPFILNRKID